MPKFDFINKKDEQRKQEKWSISKKRVLLKDEKKKSKDYYSGTIAEVIGKDYIVELADDFERIECIRAGTIISKRKNTQIISVGDRVKIQLEEIEDSKHKIIEISERESWLSRKSIIGEKEDVIAANAERLLIIMSAADPFYNKRLIDRFLISAISGGIEPAICINKIELMPLDMLKEDLAIYEEIGIPFFFISIHNNLGLEAIKEFIEGTTTIFAGPSGVGKSSLLNYLTGEDTQKISEISERTGKGRHTTSSPFLIRLNPETVIIDTPGIRELAIWNLSKDELHNYFSDFQDFYDDCKYVPCTHTHEPGCAVKKAVEDGIIDAERYQSYLNIFESIK